MFQRDPGDDVRGLLRTVRGPSAVRALRRAPLDPRLNAQAWGIPAGHIVREPFDHVVELGDLRIGDRTVLMARQAAPGLAAPVFVADFQVPDHGVGKRLQRRLQPVDIAVEPRVIEDAPLLVIELEGRHDHGHRLAGQGRIFQRLVDGHDIVFAAGFDRIAEHPRQSAIRPGLILGHAAAGIAKPREVDFLEGFGKGLTILQTVPRQDDVRAEMSVRDE